MKRQKKQFVLVVKESWMPKNSENYCRGEDAQTIKRFKAWNEREAVKKAKKFLEECWRRNRGIGCSDFDYEVSVDLRGVIRKFSRNSAW